MFKNLCLSITLATLSIAPSTQCSDRATDIKNRIEHISQEKKSIYLEINAAMTIGKKTVNHLKTSLNDAYEQLELDVTAVINTIITSEEFSSSLDKVTDYQVTCMADHTIHFNDISYNPEDYSIDGKINNELAKAFPSLDEQTELLFNIFYVTIANYRGATLLLEKLELKQNELQKELNSLEASNRTINK